MEKSYRLHTDIGVDGVLNVNMRQDIDFLDVLSLRMRQKDTYKLHSSNYGVIVGRVLANDAFGIPNAKISIFIERDSDDTTEISNIYPYENITSNDSEGRRYNLLPDYSDDSCYKVVGTFPNKRYMLDDDSTLEVYDKYWKYTTVTNQAGDYMLFGVPTGAQQLHVDIDLSDIGILSQKPRDFEYKGYNITMFDSHVQFKESTNLNNLVQLFSQNKSVNVYPFWGDEENDVAAITRCDVQIEYKFEPTCVFMGSIVSDNEGNSIGHKCAPSLDNGLNTQLVGGSGTIEMIRKTPDGFVEEYQINGNQLIDDNGVWCYQIPMNLDYVGTDEYGNVVPTDNPSKGIPTRTQVRFRISKTESGDEGFSRHTAKYLVPMNPILDETEVKPTLKVSGSDGEKMYNFGSSTPDSCFRDLYWNNVYSVKNYIPKSQVAHRPYSNQYTALKGSNLANDQNPIPFNKLRIDIPFSYVLACILFETLVYITIPINFFIGVIDDTVLWIYNTIRGIKIPVIHVKIFGWLPKLDYIGCIGFPGGFGEENTTFFPGCESHRAKRESSCKDGSNNCIKRTDTDTLFDSIQRSLGLDHKVVKLDFFQDWVNGCLYMPLWYWRKRKKKSFLFGLIKSSAKSQYCSCDSLYSRLKTAVTCNIEYKDNSLYADNNSMPNGEEKWHKRRKGVLKYRRGLIKPFENKDGLTVYYYVGMQPTSENINAKLPLNEFGEKTKIIILYATDIILLGNLDPNNLYGIPQFYNCLPSTTANIPPIGTVQENLPGNDDDSDSDDIESNAEDSGTTITTGMDWGHYGSDETPRYKTGLFMDLSCTAATTRPKSCINVERLSELGVNLDMTYDMEYRGSGKIDSGLIENDGFVSKYELDDTENRAMFATLNHIGFIPQTYQESLRKEGYDPYETQVKDDSTNYFINKFKYIYPTDFDGRLSTPMSLYKKGFEQVEEDKTDESYLTFRLGAEKELKYEKNSEGRIRHFYLKNGSKVSMPLYNNSYYFYFGIKKGSTAIDKFNSMFNAKCVKNETYPFSIDVDYKGMSYCQELYANIEGITGYPYIKVKLDDISIPYSYTLTDSTGTIVSSGNDWTVTEFEINKDDSKENKPYLTNQEYTLEVTDSNGKTLSKRIVLSVTNITIDYTSSGLGTKYYSKSETPMEYICKKSSMFYGNININGFSIDGYDFIITTRDDDDIKELVKQISAPTINADYYSYELTGYRKSYIENNSTKNVKATIVIKISAINKESNDQITSDCMCHESGDISDTVGEYSVVESEYEMDNDVHTKIPYYILRLNVYQPNRYSVKSVQLCELKETENSTNDVITVNNGESFITYLNGMPTNFILGSTSKVLDNSKFYSSKAVSSITDASGEISTSISGWLNVHDEESYMFSEDSNQTLLKNQDLWSNFVTFTDNINSAESKRSILMYKFDSIFSLSEATYVTTDSSCKFKYSAQGGKYPTLFRSIYPQNTTDKSIINSYVLDDSGEAQCDSSFPNIVGINYKISGDTFTENKPYFNPRISGGKNIKLTNTKDTKAVNYQGNYFSAFTNDGGYISKFKIDNSITVEKIPVNTAVSPIQGDAKPKGKDIVGELNDFKKALDNNSYLRGMFVDRRFDYDFTILAPYVGVDISLDPDTDILWKSSRLSGITYGGIEMAYDSDYNIISSEVSTSEDGTESAEQIDGTYYDTHEYSDSGKTILEYTYSYKGGEREDVKTILNKAKDYDKNKNNPGVFKKFYESTINGNDLSNYYWSTFNKERISEKVMPTHSSETAQFRVFDHSGDTDLFNGEYNPKDNFVTKRLIDVGNIPQSTNFLYNNTSCSYSISTELDDDNHIIATASDGESTDIDLTFGNLVTFLTPTPSEESEDYSADYTIKNNTETQDEFKILTFNNANLRFRYNIKSDGSYNVYTSLPFLIKVLSSGLSKNGISYYKTINDKNITLDYAINKIKIYDFFRWFKKGTWGYFKGDLPNGVGVIWNQDFIVNHTKFNSNYLYFMDTEESTLLSSDNTKFASIVFTYNGDLDNTEVFAIAANREYRYTEDDNLTRHIRVIETSELYDCRKIMMNIVNDNSSYAEFQNGDIIQHMGFKFSVKSNDDICGIFNDSSRINFSFRYNWNEKWYYIDDANVTLNGNEMFVSVTLSKEMTPLEQNGSCILQIFITTASGFVYRLNSMRITRKDNNPLPSGNNKIVYIKYELTKI